VWHVEDVEVDLCEEDSEIMAAAVRAGRRPAKRGRIVVSAPPPDPPVPGQIFVDPPPQVEGPPPGTARKARTRREGKRS
jgi:hypothetical protein